VKTGTIALSQRRSQLIAQAEAQRVRLSEYCAQFEGPIHLTESVAGLMGTLARSPLAITGLAAVLLKTPWRRLARFPKLAWRGWKVFQFLRGWMG